MVLLLDKTLGQSLITLIRNPFAEIKCRYCRQWSMMDRLHSQDPSYVKPELLLPNKMYCWKNRLAVFLAQTDAAVFAIFLWSHALIHCQRPPVLPHHYYLIFPDFGLTWLLIVSNTSLIGLSINIISYGDSLLKPFWNGTFTIVVFFIFKFLIFSSILEIKFISFSIIINSLHKYDIPRVPQ